MTPDPNGALVSVTRLGASTQPCGFDDGACGAPATYHVKVLDPRSDEQTDRFGCEKHTLEWVESLASSLRRLQP